MAPIFFIVVPVFNEAAFLPRAIPALVEEMGRLEVAYHVMIVENGSTDGTAESARDLIGDAPITVESLPAPDYGAAMRFGFLHADGDWVVNFDIDYFSVDFLNRVLALEDADLVIGSKRNPESQDRRPLLRRIVTRTFNLLLRLILGSGVSDTHGMKAFRIDLVRQIAPAVKSTQDLFDTELVVRAERAGYRIAEVPVKVEEIRTARSSLLKRVPRTIRGLWRIKRNLAGEGR